VGTLKIFQAVGTLKYSKQVGTLKYSKQVGTPKYSKQVGTLKNIPIGTEFYRTFHAGGNCKFIKSALGTFRQESITEQDIRREIKHYATKALE
jgi:hypothetical protein